MENYTFLIQLVLILFSARIMGEVATYFKAPSVMGELVAGILIGPSVFGLIETTPSIHLLAQMGIIFLLFEVGAETNMGRLTSSGAKSLIVATGGVVLPFAAGFCISLYTFHLSLLASLFIGSALTATSIGITLRVLRDLKKQNSHEAHIILGAAVLDDIIGIILLAMLYEFSKSGIINLWNAGKILISVVLFCLLSPLIAKYISLTIKKWEEKNTIPGLLPTTIVSLILLLSWVAHKLGAPTLLGGFAAVLALSRQFVFPFTSFSSRGQEFNHQVEKQMKPIIHLFTPVFFVSIGLSLNLKSINWGSSFIWTLTSSLFIAALFGKLLSGFLLKKESLSTKLVIGTAMIPRGEVGLIFANIGLTSGILKNEVYASIILVIALTTLLAPFALRYIYRQPSSRRA